MAIEWTTKLVEVSGLQQIRFTVKDNSKLIGVSGCHELKENENPTEPILEWLKTKLGDDLCTELEEEAESIDDTPPSVS